MIKKSHELKGLQSRLAKKEAELTSLKEEKIDINTKVNVCSREMHSLKERIGKIGKQKNIIVSEHAILRYIERVCGLDIEQYRSDILSVSLINSVEALGNGKHPNPKGFTAVVKDNVVVTIE